MCGICGVWDDGDPRPVHAMMRALHHRGPDDSGVHQDSRVALGHTRLAILDLSSAAHQPMSNPEGTVWLNYNGEVFNFEEQRALLKQRGHRFRSGSDTEVVLQLYLAYGDAFLTRLRGMFALAIYDRRRGEGRERLLLARDPLGIKPLLYAGDANRFVFASEMKALLASGLVAPRVDDAALEGLLAFGSIAQPSTIVSKVRMLPPAHRLTLEGGLLTLDSYWKLHTRRSSEVQLLPYGDQVRRLREVLEDSIRMHMVSDVPIGAFLSGGIDSAVVVGLMSRMSSHRVRTFSVGFEKEGTNIDETDDAARAATLLGTDHSRVLVTGRNVRDRILEIVTALDQPSVDGVNSYFVSAAAAGTVKVAVSGTGGDELFGGYPWFSDIVRSQRRLQGWGPRSWSARVAGKIGGNRLLQALPGSVTARALERAEAAGDLLTRFTRQYQLFGGRRARQLLSATRAAGLGPRLFPRERAAMADELSRATTVARVSALCLRGYTQNQLLRDIDAVSMAHSLEIRLPLLDPVVAEFALALPDSTKLATHPPPADSTYRATGAKRILIDATRDVLPKDIDLQTKRGFGMPFGAWLRGPLSEVLEDALSEHAVKSRGLFDPAAVAETRRQFDEGRATWALPWLLMTVELWCRQVLDRAGHPTASV